MLHAFRGVAEVSKIGAKFTAAHAASLYPEYHALAHAMRRGRAGGEAGSGPAGAGPLLGGRYTPLEGAQLRAIESDGTCAVELTHGADDADGADGDADGRRVRAMAVDAVAVLIGSAPDLSFLPPAVHRVLAASGPPSAVLDGVKATHPVFVAVEPYSMEVAGVPSLHALGPLRGDNFARFAMHDGHGVAAAVRARREATVAAEEQQNEGSRVTVNDSAAAPTFAADGTAGADALDLEGTAAGGEGRTVAAPQAACEPAALPVND